MLGLVEKLSLPFLALCLFGTIFVMAWLIFRPDPRVGDDRRDAPSARLMQPKGPLTASQRTALNRRRRLMR